MMIKPIEVTTVIIDKTLHAAHHHRSENALSCRDEESLPTFPRAEPVHLRGVSHAGQADSELH